MTVFSGCTTNGSYVDFRDADGFSITSSTADDISAAQYYVEARVIGYEDGVVTEQVLSSYPMDMSNMSPIQLLVVASHFYDERPTLMIGNYDNGTGNKKCNVWTVGGRIWLLFGEEFYVTNRQAMLNPPPYLKSEEAALPWMWSHGYSLASMKREFAEYSTED
ncbi:MAG: hypothetical protein L3J82_08525 [Planctomycetes bacterium]|nr:hypothetical protein [Planctomycetota bacterium]